MTKNSEIPRATSDYNGTLKESIAVEKGDIFKDDADKRKNLMQEIFNDINPTTPLKIIKAKDDGKKDVILRTNRGTGTNIRLGADTPVRLVPEAVKRTEKNKNGYAYQVFLDHKDQPRVYVWSEVQVGKTWRAGYLPIEHIAKSDNTTVQQSNVEETPEDPLVREEAETKAWKKKLGNGLTWEKDGKYNKFPPDINDKKVTFYFELKEDAGAKIVRGNTVYNYQNNNTWRPSTTLEIRDGKIEKIATPPPAPEKKITAPGFAAWENDDTIPEEVKTLLKDNRTWEFTDDSSGKLIPITDIVQNMKALALGNIKTVQKTNNNEITVTIMSPNGTESNIKLTPQ